MQIMSNILLGFLTDICQLQIIIKRNEKSFILSVIYNFTIKILLFVARMPSLIICRFTFIILSDGVVISNFYQLIFIKKRLQLFYMPLVKESLQISSSSHHNIAEEAQSNRDKQQITSLTDFKLPKISLPQSRGKVQSKKSNQVPKHLPLLSNQNQNAFQQIQNHSQSLGQKHKKKHPQLQQHLTLQSQMPTPKNMDDPTNDFAMQMEQQLKNILNKNKILQNESSNNENINQAQFSEEEFDFQDKINQNKQIIKMRRQQNQKQKQRKIQIQSNKLIPQSEHTIKFNNNASNQQNFSQNSQNNIENRQKPRNKTIKPTTKIETLLQKKMKDYNNSLENKFLQRKKQSIGISVKNQKQKSLPRAKSKKLVNFNDLLWHDNSTNNSSKNANQVQAKNKLSERNNQIQANKKSANSNKKVITQEQSDIQKKSHKNSSLFDNIHSFLENPKRTQKHDKMLKQLNKKMQNKDSNQIQQKIRELNQKMGLNQNNETKSTNGKGQNQNVFLTSEHNMQKTVRDWKRFQIKDKTNLQYHSSNFDKQIDYINYLQEKNTHSLSKFIDHQKIIVQLQLQKKFAKSIEKQERHTQK